MAAPLMLAAGAAEADDLSGLITTTRTILTDSRLVGNVTCTVTGAPCIVFGASRIQLRLNGFTMTGQADATTGCGGAITANEQGISTNGQTDVGIRGPGIVQRFRANGIIFAGTLRGKVEMVTATTNCQSGIRVLRLPPRFRSKQMSHSETAAPTRGPHAAAYELSAAITRSGGTRRREMASRPPTTISASASSTATTI